MCWVIPSVCVCVCVCVVGDGVSRKERYSHLFAHVIKIATYYYSMHAINTAHTYIHTAHAADYISVHMLNTFTHAHTY